MGCRAIDAVEMVIMMVHVVGCVTGYLVYGGVHA